MDSKIKIKGERLKVKGERLLLFLSIFIFQFSIPSCTENKWADWKVQNEVWLVNKAQESEVKKSESGLLYKVIADPTPQDARPNLTSTIICDYTVKLINGYKVDGGNSVSLNLANTISGFAEGCRKVHNNGDIEFYVPAQLGYDQIKFESNDYYNAEGTGTEGTMGYIPPYSTLIYTVHICGVSE
jgi:FKBP-type peptidyl-prolyl cis-trans isomerase